MILLSLILSVAATNFSFAQPISEFYSVAEVIQSITPKDFKSHRPLSIGPPPVLFHWLTIQSLKRILPKKPKGNAEMPLKRLGSEEYRSLLVRGAPAFLNAPGIYAWHNPVGATVGGSNEIYGKREAVLAMRIDPKVRIGLVVTDFDTSSKALKDASLKNRYDLILHVNGSVDSDGFNHGIIEWAILDSGSIVEVTADPVEIGSIMKSYEDALEQLSKKGSSDAVAPLERLAGPQHHPMVTYATDKSRISAWREGILANRERLPKWLTKGWVSIGPGACFDQARKTGSTSDADF